MYKRIVSLGIILMLMVSFFAVPVMAAETDADNTNNSPATESSVTGEPENDWYSKMLGVIDNATQQEKELAVTVSTNRNEYKADQKIDITIDFQNFSDNNIENISVEYRLPEGYILQEKAENDSIVKNVMFGDKQSVTVTCVPGKAGVSFTNVLFVVFCVVAVLGIVGAIVLLCKKKKNLAIFPAVLALTALVGCGVIFLQSYEKKDTREVHALNTEVLIDGKETIIDVLVRYDTVLPDPNMICVDYNLLLIDKYVNNERKFSRDYLKKGETLEKPVDPRSDVGSFVGWYTDFTYTEEFVFSKPLNESVILYAKWEIDTTDSDDDGLIDSYENYLGCDPKKIDTDNDRLMDGFEVNIGLDPCKTDTDGNGVSDYEDDLDRDGLSNGYEAEIGLNAASLDSDMDGLNDYDEVMLVKTNPLVTDTDDDGGNDFWEYNNGYNPLEYNQSFIVKVDAEKTEEYIYISAGVELELKNGSVDSLSISEVDVVDHPMVRYTLPGYLGAAYDFSVEGDFDKATLTFHYNTEFYGEPNEEFQPRIYYINEETGLYEELENQVVENGVVKATTTHFSKYILLNQVEYDKIWQEKIVSPSQAAEQEIGLLVVFLMDSSPSMAENDEDGIRLERISASLDSLGKNDRATVIPFSGEIYPYYYFTDDFEALKKYAASHQLSYGSDLSVAMNEAIKYLNQNKSQDKCIVVLSDGEVEYDPAYTKKAKEAGIKVYTVGLGPYLENPILEEIAEETGGCFYPTDTSIKVVETVKETSAVMIDYVTDSNNDGISDYYTKLLYDGKIPHGEDYMYIDLGESADYDGDGLKNGEEIKVVECDGKVYLDVKSNPFRQHSDLDGIPDNEEVIMGSNPMVYTVRKDALNQLFEDGNYAHAKAFNSLYANDEFIEALKKNASIYGVDDKQEIYRETLIDYFLNCPTQEYFEDIYKEAQKKEISDCLQCMYAAQLELVKENTEKASELIKHIEHLKNISKVMDALGKMDAFRTDFESLNKFQDKLEEFYEMIPETKLKKYTDKLKGKYKKLVTEIDKSGSLYNLVKTEVELISFSTDLLETVQSFCAIQANEEVFDRSIELLYEIKITHQSSQDDHSFFQKDRGSRSSFGMEYGDPAMGAAANDIIQMLYGNRAAVYSACLDKIKDKGISFVVGKIIEKRPYVQLAALVRDGFDMITNISEDVKQTYEMLTYAELANTTKSILKQKLDDKGSYYELMDEYKDFDVQTYVVHMVTMRVYGETKYLDAITSTGVFSFTKNKREEIAAKIRSNFEKIVLVLAAELNVPVYSNGKRIN